METNLYFTFLSTLLTQHKNNLLRFKNCFEIRKHFKDMDTFLDWPHSHTVSISAPLLSQYLFLPNISITYSKNSKKLLISLHHFIKIW